MPLESTLEFFGKGRDQAVRLPGEARFPEGVTRVLVRVRGRDRILSPAGHAWDSFFLNAERPDEDFMPEQAALEDGYRAMAADRERETEATEWCEALVGDIVHDRLDLLVTEQELLRFPG